MIRLAVLTISAACVLAGSARGAEVAFQYDPRFATVAREALWHAAKEDPDAARSRVRPIGVRCYRDARSFERAFREMSGVAGHRVVAYYAGGRDVHLRKATCRLARLFIAGRHTVITAGAFSVVLHEALHVQGLVNERLTTCFANESVRWGTLWLGFDDERALRARNLAFTFTRVYAPPEYRMSKPNCLALTRRAEWVDMT